jgi:hypothetical protein
MNLLEHAWETTLHDQFLKGGMPEKAIPALKLSFMTGALLASSFIKHLDESERVEGTTQIYADAEEAVKSLLS